MEVLGVPGIGGTQVSERDPGMWLGSKWLPPGLNLSSQPRPHWGRGADRIRQELLKELTWIFVKSSADCLRGAVGRPQT